MNAHTLGLDKGYEIKVHDHGFVRYIDHMGTDTDIVEAARVSYKSGSKGEEADKKLLAYLFRHKHTSPFEMVKVKFNIKMPIFVWRQYIRHRMQNLNEVSARYTQLPNEFFVPEKWRWQDAKNKQSSIEKGEEPTFLKPHITYDANGLFRTSRISTAVVDHYNRSYELYERMLEAGVAREQARIVLPVGIYTEFYCCWDLNNIIHFFTLRDDPHAQGEHQDYAKAMKQITAVLFPWTMECYEKAQQERHLTIKFVPSTLEEAKKPMVVGGDDKT